MTRKQLRDRKEAEHRRKLAMGIGIAIVVGSTWGAMILVLTVGFLKKAIDQNFL